jgi:ribosomal subunit interface protein
VVPDVIVRRAKDGWSVQLNPDVMPRLRVNSVYAALMKQGKSESQMNAQLQEAKWLIKNMRQRFDTILRVAQAIVERQRNFFSHGAVAMRPLVLREIADTLGLHESTISRVTTQKYMLTPHGMFELKYFFGSHVATEAGGEASSTAIRALIVQLTGAEDPKNPLSDSKIAEMLGEQGMVIARRTVAKYREALKIPPVSLRKSCSKLLQQRCSCARPRTARQRIFKGVCMNLTISGHHLDVTPAIREYVQNKLERITRHFDQVIDSHVILCIDNLTEKEKRQKAEINLRVAGKIVHVASAAHDLYAAIDMLMDRLDRQVQKYKQMLKDHVTRRSSACPTKAEREEAAAAA